MLGTACCGGRVSARLRAAVTPPPSLEDLVCCPNWRNLVARAAWQSTGHRHEHSDATNSDTCEVPLCAWQLWAIISNIGDVYTGLFVTGGTRVAQARGDALQPPVDSLYAGRVCRTCMRHRGVEQHRLALGAARAF